MTEPTLKETYHPDGSIEWQQWWLNGKRHRDNGPASIGYYQILDEQSSTKSCGSIEWQSWWLNGKRHRVDGPASIKYRLDGSILKQLWFLNGRKLTEEEFQQKKKEISNTYKVLLLQSNLPSYNDFEKWLVPEIVKLI